MKERRVIPVTDGVLTTGDLLRLAKVVSDAPSLLATTPQLAWRTFSVTSRDGITYTTKAYNELVTDDRLATLVVSAVDFSLRCMDPESSLTIRLAHGKPWSNDQIVIESEERDWVPAVAERLRPVLAGIRPQRSPIRRHRLLLHTILSVSIGSLFVRAWVAGLRAFQSTESNHPDLTVPAVKFLAENPSLVPYISWSVMIIVSWICGWIPADLALSRFDKLWPPIELETGPEHLQVEKLRRRQLVALGTLIVLPALISVATAIFI